MISNNEFREDLFYRLNVIPILIPPLRERKSDIDPLNNYFLAMYSSMLRKTVDYIDDEAKKRILDYNWPGNVRELQNTIEYAVNKTANNTISTKDLPKKITDSNLSLAKDYIPTKLSDIEKDAIINSLNHYKDNKNTKGMVARDLGISRATLYRRIKELEIYT
jgi:transcriptional regulator with PAS, ATPase and Fis domain